MFMNFIETKVTYRKHYDNGDDKKITEQLLVDAHSFAEAESKAQNEMLAYAVGGELDINAVTKSNIAEVFSGEGDKFYKLKVDFPQVDERTAKLSHNYNYVLVQATNTADAIEKYNNEMHGTVADYVIAAVAETKIINVI